MYGINKKTSQLLLRFVGVDPVCTGKPLTLPVVHQDALNQLS